MAEEPLHIPAEVARRLGYYVYLYVDPRTERVFYVGKGQGERVLAHLSAEVETRKGRILDELRQAGLRPRLDILAHQLPDHETALRIEAAVIDLVGLADLTNLVRGWRSLEMGRIPLEDLITYYAAKPVEVTDPAILIRINRLDRHGMSELELYEATRGVWKLGERRKMAQFAMAVFEGVVREVYSIHSWHRGGTLTYTTRPADEVHAPDRWEFRGEVAPDTVRARYLYGSVASYFKRGQQNPTVYVNA
jgi:uncharacterized protein